jgi:hypothetical protein
MTVGRVSLSVERIYSLLERSLLIAHSTADRRTPASSRQNHLVRPIAN